MTYKRGVYVQEESTALTPMTVVANPTVVIGTAFKGKVNEPVLCQTFSEFVDEFGFSGDLDNYTLEEAAYVFFNVYNVRPLICVNVLDLTRHKKATTKSLSGTSNPLEITGAIILSSVVVKSGSNTLTLNTDYKLAQSGTTLTITVLKQDKIVEDTISVQYNEADASKVTKADVMGTVSGGEESGLYCLEKIFPHLMMIPGVVICPKWSTDPEVALAMAARSRSINETFKALAIADLPVTLTNYQDLYEYKTTNSLQDEYLALCWPQVQVGEQSHWLSTHMAALMNLVDASNDDIPFESPSNKSLRISGASVTLSKPKANTLAGYGIITALNWSGWRLWSSRMSVYPFNDDPKDSWLPVRRMFNYLAGVLAVNYFSRIDAPIRKRLVEQIVDEVQLYLNGLVARGALLDGRIAFLEVENPVQSLIDGQVKFHLYIGALVPARVIEFVLEFDTKAYASLFS